MRLVSAVDLPVPVEGAGVGQLLAADLAGDGRLAVGVHWRKRVAVACIKMDNSRIENPNLTIANMSKLLQPQLLAVPR